MDVGDLFLEIVMELVIAGLLGLPGSWETAWMAPGF